MHVVGEVACVQIDTVHVEGEFCKVACEQMCVCVCLGGRCVTTNAHDHDAKQQTGVCVEVE